MTGEEMPSDLWTCHLCNKVLLRKSIYSHLRVVHFWTNEQVEAVKDDVSRQAAQSSAAERRDVVCPLCDDRFITQEQLAKHCEEEHEEEGAEGEPQDYTVFTISFRSKQEYDEWLEDRQQHGGVSFHTRDSSHSRGTIYLSKLLHIRCNRAGRYVKQTETQATHTKKDVSHCSCFLNVKIEDDGICECERLPGTCGPQSRSRPLTPDTSSASLPQRAVRRCVKVVKLNILRNTITVISEICLEFSHDYIIKRLRKESPASTSRLHYVTKGDLWSLVKLIITPQQVEWLKKFSHRGISVDDTHNATRYNLKLATVTVLNERDAGVPAAFLLSGTMTSADVEKLFLEIQSVIPEFNPKQIVTDEAPCFYNGFRSVFPHSQAKLHYCRWHIERTWQRNAVKLIKEPQIRNRLKKMLRDLLKIEDLPTFQQKFGEILAFLRVEGQGQMEDYLRRNYLNRTPTWASFSNQGAIMDTTMISERNANARADCLVDLLIRAVEEMSKSDEIKARRRLAEASYRVQQTAICHPPGHETFWLIILIEFAN
ncbi:zinc finger, C2H2 type [Ostertagia ostertagi]